MIELQIDEFLNVVCEAGLLFKKGLENYLSKSKEEFTERLTAVSEYERKADELRLSIEKQLYMNTLIPENRGDVLAILENTDEVIDRIKETLVQFSVETPKIPSKFDRLFLELSTASIQSVDCLIKAVRAFFTDISSINDHIHKIHFYEKEADKIAERLKREIFQDEELHLSHKMHLRYFTSHVENISDYAEDVSDRLAIYAIKRRL
ncbi:MAG: DUF47 family protein [Candidatus Cloacimonetes bacterium]|nr:DUF47 family protein [Candidatus Cloacimonadota bacterium]MBL7087111.1 DUF47 family protein [Candidatus Cloacimonadota bacterium]